jgi:hypothetical protein
LLIRTHRKAFIMPLPGQPGERHALPLLAPLGALAFTLTWFVLGLISPGYQLFDIVIDSYSPISQPISGLGLGQTALYMNSAFVLCGACMAVGGWAAVQTWPHDGRRRQRTTVGVLIALCGIGMMICGLFSLESVMMHSLGFLLAIGAPAVGFVIGGRMLRNTDGPLSTWLLIAGPLSIATLVLFLVTFDPYSAGDNVGVAGLTQRVVVSLTVATVGLIGYRSRSRTTHAQATLV